MKKLYKISSIILVIAIVFSTSITAFAVTTGQQYKVTEAGWQRFDDTDTYINYVNKDTSWVISKPKDYYTEMYRQAGMGALKGTNATFKIKFYGTKLRLIGGLSNTYSNNVEVDIDGVKENISLYNSTFVQQILFYEKIGLNLGKHTVTVTVKNTASNAVTLDYILDAIEIDDTGYLIDYSAPTNLTATAGINSIILNWDVVEGAASYNVKRAITAGGPYETVVSNVYNTTYTDEPLVNGTTYYYIVTAIVNGLESSSSNEAFTTPTGPVIIGNSAILEITMTNGEHKEYDMTATEIADFLSWYDASSTGSTKAYYIINKKDNIKPFLSRKEYIAFNKISSFEVKEYIDN